MDQKKIGVFLKELRREKGITQEKFAEALNVSGRTVSRWETGSNMPDISLLADIANFYDVSIPEIIDGERKSEKMNNEVKEVAEKMSDYADNEKESIIKEIRKMSIIAAAALIIYEILNTTGLSAQGGALENISLYLQTLVFVMVFLLPLYTTGLISKLRRSREPSRIAKPVLIVLSLIIAFAAALVLKMIFAKMAGL